MINNFGRRKKAYLILLVILVLLFLTNPTKKQNIEAFGIRKTHLKANFLIFSIWGCAERTTHIGIAGNFIPTGDLLCGEILRIPS